MIDLGYGVKLSTEIPAEARLWRNNPEIRRWCRQTSLISKEQQESWLESIKRDPSIQMFGVQTPKGNSVGVAGLTSISMTHRTAEFSLYIAPEFQKNGLGVLALRTLLGYGFNELGLNNIWGEVLDGNPALRIFEAVGFVNEGVHRATYYKDGKTWDSHRISMLKEEFNK